MPLASPSFITVVSGLPRSGTSLMMQMLSAGGVPVLADQHRLPDENNPRGYFEFEPVKRLRTNQSWLPAAQGYAVKIIHLLLPELPTDGRFAYRVLFMQRPIEEILASQRAMLQRQGKPGAADEFLRTTYEHQLQEREHYLAAHDCFRYLNIEYHHLISSPADVAAEVAGFLELPLDVEKMVAAVDPSLYRQRAQ